MWASTAVTNMEKTMPDAEDLILVRERATNRSNALSSGIIKVVLWFGGRLEESRSLGDWELTLCMGK